ncbi:hypothetical protein PITCH_A570001 [uncultured Desulfobacterium sp.]|uniref:Uncharacterized protein n=1 Tax=uncultured Desulfobacterium sp. TaxID=201089 RepID=A0A445N0V4_9BACT|nr:hypothetical protein PITCH_A570001 [uncultured Desulfobacterium sp.]
MHSKNFITTQSLDPASRKHWIPAFAGMTVRLYHYDAVNTFTADHKKVLRHLKLTFICYNLS